VVGTQYTDGTITDALSADPAVRAQVPSNQQGMLELVSGDQGGIKPKSGLTARFQNNQDVNGGLSMSGRANSDVPNWCGADVAGDERREGPIYNYARVFTRFQLARCLTNALDTTVNHIKAGISVRNRSQLSPQELTQRLNDTQHHAGDWNEPDNAGNNLIGTSVELAKYCNLDSSADSSLEAYPRFEEAWRDNTFRVFASMFAAAATAIFVQWGTTGAAVIIAYLTPAKGLGCRSGAYVLYGALGTAAWLLLLTSMLLSHAAMLRYQNLQRDHPSMNFSQNPAREKGRGVYNDNYRRYSGHSLICGAAVLTRLLGKLIAICNAVWIVLISLLEFIGMFENCWCSGDVLSMGENGWIALFKGPADLKVAAQSSWAGGFTLSILISLGSFTFFWLGSRKSWDN
jgi:hypothetical protein